MSALEFRNIHKSFGAVETLKGIDIALDSGEFLVLLGPSGCGKSTLLNIVAGLAEPTSGDVLIGEKSVNGVHPKNRDIAMVFQSYALYPNLSVARNIGFGLEMRKVPAPERAVAIRDVARLLKIEDLLDRKPAQLSGGQRQRVAIGRALVRKPQVFLFDEPLSNLDAKLRMEMRTELKRLHQLLKTTIVYVTHDQIEAMTLATRIAIMHEGRIEQLGTPEDIYNAPATRYVATFVGAPPMNMIDATVADKRLALDGTDVRLTIPDGLTGLSTGEKLVVGLRPEALYLDPEGQLTTICDVAELTGPELVTTASLGNQQLVATLPPAKHLKAGDPVKLGFAPESLHLFDRTSGKRRM